MRDKLFDISRFEIKCFIPENMAEQVREMARPYVRVDPYAVDRPNFLYTVRSLYFDSATLDFYYEKIDGLKIRKKLRVRAYNDGPDNHIGFLEIKRRYANNILKERYKMPIEKIEKLLAASANIPLNYKDSTNGQAALSKFIYNLEKQKLVPTVLIVYDREPYVGNDDQTIRLTMDVNIRAKMDVKMSDLFTNSDLVPVYQNKCILEFKYDDFMPMWMRKILSNLKIQPQSISKYCSGIDSHLKPIRA